MPDVDYVRPCKTKTIRDDFKAHVARGSVLPGLDYACNSGDKIYATANGTVVLAEAAANDVRGISIEIKHPDGNRSHYLHLSKLLVKTGQRVKAGDTIALSGNTGVTSTGAHLHFAIKDKRGKAIDPAKILKREAKEARIEKREAAAAAATPEVTSASPATPDAAPVQ